MKTRTAYMLLFFAVTGAFFCPQGEAETDVNLPADILAERAPMVISGNKRFMVRGLDPDQAVLLGKWAEEVADRIEHIIGFPLPFGPNQRVVLSCGESPLDKPPRVFPQQRMTEYFLMQKLYIYGYEKLEREALLEALTWTLLNRYAIAKQPRETRRDALSQVPAWFSIGCAQHVFEEQYRARRNAILAEWEAGSIPRLAEVFSYGESDVEQASERAACGLAFGWLVARHDFHELVPPIFSRWGGGEPVDTAWLINRFPDINNVLELEKHWDLWLAHAGRVDRSWAMSPAEQIHRLKSLMVFQPGHLKIPYPVDAPESLTWEDLLDAGEASWFTPLVSKLRWKVLFLSMGPQPEFKDIVTQYVEYLDRLLEAEPKQFSQAKARRDMLKILGDAHGALTQLERMYLMRRSYVDQFDQHKAGHVPGS